MISFSDFLNFIETTSLAKHRPHFEAILNRNYYDHNHGDRAHWQAGLDALPNLHVDHVDLNSDTITISGEAVSESTRQAMQQALMHLHPWRKGPFQLFDSFIDTEWRSDWKWQRVQPHISPLKDRYVLDIGCGSGYHCWRMRGEGAKLVVGIDPSPKFLYQFHAIKRYVGNEPVFYLPAKSEEMPANMQAFDTVFSMGVLYHRHAPFMHLNELKQALKPGGELVLETLTIDGEENTVLVPPDRYAQMPNVWFIPSAKTLLQWVARAGFVNATIVDINTTTLEEQRSTEWMRFHSLVDFLKPEDHSQTVEGLPAPQRSVIVARKPD